MFFYVDYTEENVRIYKKKIEEFEDSELCWNIREGEPVMVMKNRIRGDPLNYRKYPDESPKEKKVDKRGRVELVTLAQVKQFINEVYCPCPPKNAEVYLKRRISTQEIYNLVKTYTTVFREKTSQSFAAWCRSNKLNFLLAKEKKSQNVTRELYILEDVYYGKPRCA